MADKHYEWGALGRVDQRSGKFQWANPDDSYYRAFSFLATAFWDGHRWIRIARQPVLIVKVENPAKLEV